MSEASRYARALATSRERSFSGRHPVEESKRRLAAALKGDRVAFEGDRVRIRTSSALYEGAWVASMEGARLEGRFVQRPAVRWQLTGLSVLLALMMLASFVSVLREGGAERFAIPGVTALMVLFFMPLYIVALGSAREGDESRLERAMRVALEDLDPKMPPPQKWKDEE